MDYNFEDFQNKIKSIVEESKDDKEIYTNLMAAINNSKSIDCIVFACVAYGATAVDVLGMGFELGMRYQHKYGYKKD